jgi:hypothetical protein
MMRAMLYETAQEGHACLYVQRTSIGSLPVGGTGAPSDSSSASRRID